MLNPLAIVIPAYKLSFFDEALKSIAAQTNKNFTVYIGDDFSPEDLPSIVSHYENQFNIVYHKFPENLGHISIVKHWERCVEMTKGEEWIWIFSDDDIMSDVCVDSFLTGIQDTNRQHDVYRFNCRIIDDVGRIITESSSYPTIQTSHQFLNTRLSYTKHSYIVNYIFNRNVYLKYNGFVDFQAAWAADDATWILFGQDKNIYTLREGEIKWRQSAINISGNRNDMTNRQRKYIGTEQFIEWIYKWAKQNSIHLNSKLIINWLMIMMNSIGYKNNFSAFMKSKIFKSVLQKENYLFQLKFILLNIFNKQK
jgi:glycosyltransferase involved in cell wall biosynthesis